MSINVKTKMIALANLFLSQIRRHGWLGFVRRLPYYFNHFRTYGGMFINRSPAADNHLFASAKTKVSTPIRLHPDLMGVAVPIDLSVSVVIPTLNAGVEFSFLLRKLKAQQGVRAIEIVIVDSGSTDDTVEVAHEAGCTVMEIPPHDFSHSYARNTGAAAASGDYLLFMVQDAYPIGRYWVYGMLRYLLDHASKNLAAVSCAEFSRSDSDMMYDSIINTHYRFLGCLEYDRIGEYQGDDHLSLRSHGQLSDVSCLIGKELFNRYLYRGDYAEDLDLGIRLIKDGHRVAMLASVKTVHSHNRPAYYYLKRSFVDVIFLVRLFDDFTYPRIDSPRGLVAGIASTAALLSDYFADYDEAGSDIPLGENLQAIIRDWRRRRVSFCPDPMLCLGDSQLDDYIMKLTTQYLNLAIPLANDEQREARRFWDAFYARLEHFNAFACKVYGEQDVTLRRELREVIRKTFAATAGSALGFLYMDYASADGRARLMVEAIKAELKAGI